MEMLWTEWLTNLDAKKIGTMYIIVAILMFVKGGADAIMLRLQTAVAVGDTQGPFDADMFQQVVTAHGTIMIFS